MVRVDIDRGGGSVSREVILVEIGLLDPLAIDVEAAIKDFDSLSR